MRASRTRRASLWTRCTCALALVVASCSGDEPARELAQDPARVAPAAAPLDLAPAEARPARTSEWDVVFGAGPAFERFVSRASVQAVAPEPSDTPTIVLAPFTLSAEATDELWPHAAGYSLCGWRCVASLPGTLYLSVNDARRNAPPDLASNLELVNDAPVFLVFAYRCPPDEPERCLIAVGPRGARLLARDGIPEYTRPAALEPHVRGWWARPGSGFRARLDEAEVDFVRCLSWNGPDTDRMAEVQVQKTSFTGQISPDSPRDIIRSPVSQWPHPLWVLRASFPARR